MNSTDRLGWTEELDFDVAGVRRRRRGRRRLEYLFWVGCAGAYEDRAKKTTQAVADAAAHGRREVRRARRGRDLHRRLRPPRRQRVPVPDARAAERRDAQRARRSSGSSSPARTASTRSKNEYPQVGGEYEVVHHTQLLDQLVARQAAHARCKQLDETITYHDPCYLGRHNKVYTPPRDLLKAMPGAEVKEMPRNGRRRFCCGAGGARMWMEEQLGTRDQRRTAPTRPSTPARRRSRSAARSASVMLTDGVAAVQADGPGRRERPGRRRRAAPARVRPPPRPLVARRVTSAGGGVIGASTTCHPTHSRRHPRPWTTSDAL